MKELPEILDQFFEQYQQYQATKENSPHPELFSAAVKIAINEYGISALAIATNFEVATSTVERWAKGQVSPHPRLQNMIISYIAQKI